MATLVPINYNTSTHIRFHSTARRLLKCKDAYMYVHTYAHLHILVCEDLAFYPSTTSFNSELNNIQGHTASQLRLPTVSSQEVTRHMIWEKK